MNLYASPGLFFFFLNQVFSWETQSKGIIIIYKDCSFYHKVYGRKCVTATYCPNRQAARALQHEPRQPPSLLS